MSQYAPADQFYGSLLRMPLGHVNMPMKVHPVRYDARKESMASMVKPLTYQEAHARIRKDAATFTFTASSQHTGRVDVVSLGTKTPCEDFCDVRVMKSSQGLDVLYAGIFDGHNGMETAELLSRSLISYVANTLADLPADDSADTTSAIQQAFVALDDRILDIAKAALAVGHPAGAAELRVAMGPAHAGSCALLVIYDPKSATLHTAVTGDSRAVRGQWPSEHDEPVVDVLTKDQNACNEQEYARIAAAHPGEEEDIMDKESGDFMNIAVTRAFGNYKLKWPAELVRRARSSFHGPKPLTKSKTPPYMTARPEVTTRVVTAQDYVILGSDGFWEAISSELAVECVSRWLVARRAGRPEPVIESRESRYDIDPEHGGLSRTVRAEDLAIEDLDNAAVCLLKNVLGGRHRYMVAGALTAIPPLSRLVRDDITVQVIFFQAP